MTDLIAVAGELYGHLPAEFTRARNDRARELRDDAGLAAAVRALPKPATAAWLANAMVRHLAEEVNGVLELGAELRRAQADLDAAQLRELTAQRRRLVAALARRGRDLAGELGQKVSAGVLEQVAATLNAAMAGEDAAAALRTGLLAQPMDAGSPVDLATVVAVPGAVGERAPGVAPLARKRAARQATEARAREEAARALGRAQEELASAEARAGRADRRRRRAEDRVRTLQAGVLQARAEVEELRRRLEAAEDSLERAADELAGAEDDRDQAVGDDEEARADVAAARRALERLRVPPARG